MSACPDLETLFAALDAGEGEALDHAAECPHCAALLEEHRQLEKDLFRLSDPLPPANFVSQVMARVAEAPMPARMEVGPGLAILAVSLCLAVGSFLLGHGQVAHLGTSVASAVVSARVFFGALGNAVGAVWHSAASTMSIVLTLMFFAGLLGLKKVSPASTSLVRVSP